MFRKLAVGLTTKVTSAALGGPSIKCNRSIAPFFVCSSSKIVLRTMATYKSSTGLVGLNVDPEGKQTMVTKIMEIVIRKIISIYTSQFFSSNCTCIHIAVFFRMLFITTKCLPSCSFCIGFCFTLHPTPRFFPFFFSPLILYIMQSIPFSIFMYRINVLHDLLYLIYYL
jgi:hypothetical protein